ncbi:MAG: hypothetical protein M1819_006345 [Sarea resinae]|nr:MAG: hypothetical protein M1819_006345 [Sarea resinae]
MADRVATRSFSRRDNPQSPPKPPVTRRTVVASSQSPEQNANRKTRSQSRELGSRNPARNEVKRATRRGVRQESAESAERLGSRAGQKGKAGTKIPKSKGAKALSSVAEEAIVEYPNVEEESVEDQIEVIAEGHPAEGHDEDDEQEDDQDEDDEEDDQDLPARESQSPGYSVVSGATGQTTYSAQELSELDPRELLETLPDLSQASESVLKIIAPKQASPYDIATSIAKDLQVPGSTTGRRLARMERNFQTVKEVFGSEHYIKTSIILRGLLQEMSANNIGVGPWRPDVILQKANIATLVSRVLTMQGGTQDAYQVTQLLDRIFPTPFLDSLMRPSDDSRANPGSSKLLQETFDLALNIRTQLLIVLLARLRSAPNYDPDRILTQVFFEAPVERSLELSQQEDTLRNGKVRGWDISGLGGAENELSEEFTRFVHQRVQYIREFFPEDIRSIRSGDYADLERLEEAFPWTDFIAEVVSWSKQRLDEIERHLDAQGGAEAVRDLLEQEMQRRPADAAAASNEVASAPPSLGPRNRLAAAVEIEGKLGKKVFSSPTAISLLKKYEANPRSATRPPKPATPQAPPRNDRIETLAEPSSQPQRTSPRHHASPGPSTAPSKPTEEVAAREDEMDAWPPPDMDDEDEPLQDTYIALPSSQQALGKYKLIQKDKNKENIFQPRARNSTSRKRAFIERQPDAERVPFGDGLDDSQAPPSGQGGLSRSKRPRPVEQDDDEEEEMEQDNRPVDPNRRNRAPPAPRLQSTTSPPPRSPKRIRVRPNESTPASSPNQEVVEAVMAHNRSSQAPRPTPYQHPDFQCVNEEAKRVVATRTAAKVQTRRPWSAEACSRFIELIEDPEYGTSWAKIDRLNDPLLEGRGQVGLKDKARNMKFDYLKSGLVLPWNFELIQLNRGQIERLHKLGIDYQQASARAHD